MYSDATLTLLFLVQKMRDKRHNSNWLEWISDPGPCSSTKSAYPGLYWRGKTLRNGKHCVNVSGIINEISLKSAVYHRNMMEYN